MLVTARETNHYPFDKEETKIVHLEMKPSRRDFGSQTEPEADYKDGELYKAQKKAIIALKAEVQFKHANNFSLSQLMDEAQNKLDQMNKFVPQLIRTNMEAELILMRCHSNVIKHSKRIQNVMDLACISEYEL